MLKKKTKLIILGSSVVILTSTIFSTVRYKENMNNVQKQKVIASNILLKKVSDKKILDKKIEDAKVLAKKIADEKIRVAKLNEGITFKEAIAICDKLKKEDRGQLYSDTVLTPISKEAQLVKGSLFYEFEVYTEGNEVGSQDGLWNLCISKKTGKAYTYFTYTKRLIAYVSDSPSEPIVTKPVEQVKINDGVGVYDKAYAPKDLVVKDIPGQSYVTVGTIKKGTMINVYGGVPIGKDQGDAYGCDQYGWSKIRYNGSDAWVKADELRFADPYNWAPGIKEKFEKEMVGQYANNKSSIKYSIWKDTPKFDIGPGFYQVYTDRWKKGTNTNPVVNVNVKTGWYHG